MSGPTRRKAPHFPPRRGPGAAPWGDMIGYAWVWGFGAVLFVALAALLARQAPAAVTDKAADPAASGH